ncbi:zinc ABC transporter substrate-binding protein [bacterium]|nr:zinc ABC transporter substrate-binding protein [bacterium]
MPRLHFRQTQFFPFFAAVAFGLVLLGGCSSKSEATKHEVSELSPIRVVATTSMIADLVSVVGGPYVQVEGLMGPNVDPHLYKASEGDVSLMSKAHLVVYSGLHLEGKMVDIFEQMTARGLNVHALTDVFQPEQLLESEYFAGNHDPHFWFDVTMWKAATKRVAELLSNYDPDHAPLYLENASNYEVELDSLHQSILDGIALIPPDLRVLVTSHDAFGYFGRAYGVEVKGLQGLSTATEAGTADVQALAAFVSQRRIPALFLESSISPRGIEAVVAAVRDKGFEVRIGGTLYGDALGSVGSGAETYVGMVRANVETLVSGLSN